MFTETYIKMCKTAEPIQKLWEPCLGDYVASDSSNHGLVFEGILTVQDGRYVFQSYGKHPFRESGDIGIFNTFPCIDDLKDSCYIWIPLQHQLQSISGFPWFKYDEKCREIVIGSICRLKRAGFADDAFSKEEAGIMLIMKKFNRQWTGEGWEEIK